MGKNCFLITFLTIFIAISLPKSYAADTLTKKNPAAVLVQLRSEHNRIQALKGVNKFAELNEVKKDAAGVNSTMIRDFTDHLTYCPVYYFYDSSVDLIMQRKFNGVLLNAAGSPATNIVISDTDRKYMIVYYGYPLAQARTTKTVAQAGSQNDSGEPMGKGLVINNSNYEQVSFFYKFGYDDVFLNTKRNRKYIYNSRHFDMEYYPFAEKLNDRLKEHHKKIRITHVNGFTDELFEKRK
jgi:hypothetical protein